MKITANTQIAGLPAYRIRTLLRQSGTTLAWPLTCYPAYAKPSETLEVMHGLVAAGLLRLQNDLGRVKFFRRTSQGTAVANADVPTSLTRAEALAIVGQVIEFLHARGQDKAEELEVAELRIIGELVCGAETIPHVEIGVVLRYRMGTLGGDVEDPYAVDAEASDRFMARLTTLHPAVCVRRMPPQGAA